jgi:hypothetical protein
MVPVTAKDTPNEEHWNNEYERVNRNAVEALVNNFGAWTSVHLSPEWVTKSSWCTTFSSRHAVPLNCSPLSPPLLKIEDSVFGNVDINNSTNVDIDLFKLINSNNYFSSMPTITTTNVFELVDSLEGTQRQSYPRENRCLRPNPLLFRQRPDSLLHGSQHVTHGTVTVKLATPEGVLLCEDSQNFLENLDGPTTLVAFTGSKAFFYGKLTKTSAGALWVLRCTIAYYVCGSSTRHEEILVSTPFVTVSNTKRKRKRKQGPAKKNCQCK